MNDSPSMYTTFYFAFFEPLKAHKKFLRYILVESKTWGVGRLMHKQV